MERDTEVELMDEFADRTGLTSDQQPTRYLWTDAYAVCNWVGFARELEESRFLELAEALVHQVHHVLGRHRQDDDREGWLSGLEGTDAQEHPTMGGLRIGKPKPERGADESYNARAEWDRDGQYFHYLTKWMHALDIMARATGELRYHRWSRELANTAHDAFVYHRTSADAPRMYWKMSIDLSRPLVPSMGQHDPLDGLVTAVQIRDTARQLDGVADSTPLQRPVDDFAYMIEGRDFATDDPLGLGGLLMDAVRVAQVDAGASISAEALRDDLLDSAHRGLQRFVRTNPLQRPARSRLAFRELGLAIGLEGVELLHDTLAEASEAGESLTALQQRDELVRRVVNFWLEPGSRREATWTGHRDINEVMLATALSPAGVLSLQ
ncbi:MAG: hypothetical protein ACQEVA_21045 [Myxococcota bacterium]